MINFGKNPLDTDLMLLDYLSKTGNDLAKSLAVKEIWVNNPKVSGGGYQNAA